MVEKIETVVVGGGQAGLATSYHLTQCGREHVVLEQADRAGSAWRNGRWDSFTLVTPNSSFQLPGAAYDGPAPHGFMRRDEIVARFEKYVEKFRLPVHFGVSATSVEPLPDGPGYRVRAEEAVWETRNVVVATGLYQRPKLPRFAAGFSPKILQLHSGEYRNPASLPAGAVLVVGSAQSGCQIVEELYQSGRRVYLSIGSAGRVPRRYRGKDIYEWLALSGFFDQTADKLPSPQARFAGNPHLTGRDGGHTLNLHQFARDGVVLLGRLQAADGTKVGLAPDLKASLAKVDNIEVEILRMIDGAIERSGTSAPPETPAVLRDGYRAGEVAELDLQTAGITTVLWAIGYAFDFSFVRLPAFEANGFPIQKGGLTAFPGLFFVGIPWLDKRKSGLLAGVGEDAAAVAARIAGTET